MRDQDRHLIGPADARMMLAALHRQLVASEPGPAQEAIKKSIAWAEGLLRELNRPEDRKP